MKVLLLGNMNGNSLVIATWLLDRKIQVDVFSFKGNYHWDEEVLHGKKVIEILNLSKIEVKSIFSKEFRKFLLNYDKIIGQNIAPAICYFHRIKLDIFIPHGGDIRWTTNYKRIKLFNSNFKNFFIEMIITFLQNKGIKCSKNIWLRKMDYILMPKYIYKKFKTQPYPSPNCELFDFKINKKVIKSNTVIKMICPARHEWNENQVKPSDKGQDIIIKGIHNYVQKKKKLDFRVLFFEYGKDVKKSKKLISDLNINKYFLWHEKTKKKKDKELIEKSEIVILEGRLSIEYNSIHAESIAACKPIMAYRDENKLLNDEFTYDIELNFKYNNFGELLEMYNEDKEYYMKKSIERKKKCYDTYMKTVDKMVEIIGK